MVQKGLKMNKQKRGKKIFCIILMMLLAFVGYRLLTRSGMADRECQAVENENCEIYYLLDIDGMKGLGHSALMLVDEAGEGRIFSYNGMQYNLFQCLLGKKGIGKMKEFVLDESCVTELLDTGKLPAGEYEECSDFDRALWRGISREQYEQILQAVELYIKTEEEYMRLCEDLYQHSGGESEEIQRRIDDFLAREDTPLYQIYTHNCDTAARELMGEIDEEVKAYNQSDKKLTPNGNYRNMCKKLGNTWGFRRLGEDTLKEIVLNYFI